MGSELLWTSDRIADEVATTQAFYRIP
jgi:hypothetical protein